MPKQNETEYRIASLSSFEDDRGRLTVAQDEVPFEIKRVYWIEALQGSTRGCHRHIVTQQAFIVLSGSVEFHLQNEHNTWRVALDSPSTLLYLAPEIWHRLEFMKDSIVLALASHEYSKADYVAEPYEH